MAGGIYTITNTTNGHRYVGSALALGSRRADHFRRLRLGAHHSRYLQRAWNKYGPDAFRFEVLEECDPEFLVSAEQWWMNMLRPEYNICPTASSSLGVKHTPETIEKYRAAVTGRKLSPEQTAAKTARMNDPETVAKLRAAQTGRTLSAETRAKQSAANKGRKLSEEHKAKISERSKGNKYGLGRVVTPETRAKQSASMKLFLAKKRGTI